MSNPTQSSTADVRRKLQDIRRVWREHDPRHPFHTCYRFPDGTTFAAFATQFVASHHRPRNRHHDAAAPTSSPNNPLESASSTSKAALPAAPPAQNATG